MTTEFNRLFDEPSGGAKTIQAPTPQPPPPGQQAPGSITQFLHSSAKPPGGGARPAPYVTAKVGEATQMFQAPTRTPTGQGIRPAAPPPLPPAPPSQRPLGEFTQMMQRGGGPSPYTPPAAPSSDSGGFTDFMARNPPPGNPGGMGMATPGGFGGNADYMPSLPQQPFTPPPPQKPHDFDELFGGVKAQAQPQAFHNPQFGGTPAMPGFGATGMFGSAGPGGPPASSPNSPFGAAALTPGTGPGSYTDFMNPGSSPSGGLGLGQQAPKAAPPPAAPRKRVPNWVWIVGGLVLTLLILTIAYFAFFRKH